MEKLKKPLPLLLVFAVYAFPVIFLYARNVKEVSLSEIILPLSLLLLLGYTIFALALLVFKKMLSAALFSALVGLVLLNYDFVAKVATKVSLNLRIWHIVPMALVCILLLVYVISRKKPAVQEPIALMLTVTFGALILVNSATAAIMEISKLAPSKLSEEFTDISVTKQADRPNIYYIILDEYASFYQLQNYLGYDNNIMYRFLEDNGFNISIDSFNECDYTDVIITNIMSLNYVTDLSKSESYNKGLRFSSPLVSMAENAGYKIRGIGDTDWMGIKSEEALDGKPLHNSDAGAFMSMVFTPTVFHSHAMDIRQFGNTEPQIASSMNMFDNLDIEPNTSQLTFYYLCSPHTPFYYNADGTLTPEKDYFAGYGIDNTAYVEQLKYITTRTNAAVKRILDKDPKAIILYTSDHSYRSQFNANSTTPTSERRRILNAVYYQNDLLPELQGKSGVNTMRLVLNKVLDLELPYVEVPKFENE